MMPQKFFMALIFLACLIDSSVGQIATGAPESAVTQVDLYVKIIGAVITALATLFGLPIVFLSYKKTRSEITKLELEAAALREKLPTTAIPERLDQGGIQIKVENSPNVRVIVSADPRFLAPLLLLMDFIFAWLILTLAGYLLSVFNFGFFRTIALGLLAAILLLPIAKEVLRVRTVLRPPKSATEINASIQQAKIGVYVTYTTIIFSTFAFGALILFVDPIHISELEQYLGWTLIGIAVILGFLVPAIKPRIDRYLTKLVSSTGASTFGQ